MKALRVTLSGTSPAAAGRAVIDKLGGLEAYEQILVVAELVGATGGTLDVYLQRKVAEDKWADWIHFPQLAAGAAAVKYSAAALPPATATPTVIGVSAEDVTAGAAPALAANTVTPGHPGSEVRVVAVAGGGTSAGAAVLVHVSAQRAD